MKNITPAILICFTTLCQAQSSPATEMHPSLPSINARGGVSCDTVDFNLYTTNTVITDQYLSCGVVFDNAVVHDYGAGSYGPIIHGYSDWYDSLVVRFVDPGNINMPRPVQYFSFLNAIDPNISSETDYITVRCYDVGNNLVASVSNTSASRAEVQLSAPLIARAVIDDSAFTAYALDNFVFDLPGTTGVDHLQAEPTITVFPDPVIDELQVEGVPTLSPIFLITDVNGRELLRPVAVRNGATWRLDLRALSAGMYFLRITGSDRPYVRRVIKN